MQRKRIKESIDREKGATGTKRGKPPLRLVEIVGRAFIAGGLISLLIYVIGEIHYAAYYYGFYDVAGATILIGIGMGILLIRWILGE